MIVKWPGSLNTNHHHHHQLASLPAKDDDNPQTGWEGNLSGTNGNRPTIIARRKHEIEKVFRVNGFPFAVRPQLNPILSSIIGAMSTIYSRLVQDISGIRDWSVDRSTACSFDGATRDIEKFDDCRGWLNGKPFSFIIVSNK